MVSKQDCLLLLFELKNSGVEGASEVIKDLLKKGEPTLDTIKFIQVNKPFEAQKFYEKIRKSYNLKKSKLYINIVKEDLQPREILTCLASLNLQILLYNADIADPMFLRHMRFEEIQKCMLNYYSTGDIIPCQRLLQLFKADLKAFESFKQK